MQLVLADSGAEYAVAAAMLVLALVLALLALGANRWFTRLSAHPTSADAPEWGGRSGHKTWVQLRLRYAVIALVFVAFDMEMVFMFPWAVAFRRTGLVGLIDMFVFTAILVSAIWFAWKGGAFDWER